MTPLDALAGLVILSAVNYAITTIITESSLFEPVRLWVQDMHEEIGVWLECPLCMGTWVGFAIAAITVARLGLTGWDIPLGFVVISFSTVAGSLVLKRAANW